MNEGKGERSTVVWATILLALDFIWQLMPDDEMPSPLLNTLSIIIELGMLIGVLGLVPRILRSLPEGAPRGGWIFLLVVAVVSGLGIFAIRVAGGPRRELSARTSAGSTEADEMRKQLRELVRSAAKRGDKFAASRWIQALAKQDPAEMRKLTRQDLQDVRKLGGELREDIERILKAFAQAESKRIDVSTASSEPGASRPETWRAAQQGYNAFHEQLALIEQNWDEWLADPFLTSSGDLKPWQKETQRLSEIAAEASQQFHALTQPGASPSAPSTEAATLAKQLQEAIDRFGKLVDKLATTRWATLKKDPATAGMRTRNDLQEIREISSQVRESAEGALRIIAQAKSKGVDLATFDELGRPEFWSAMQQVYKAGLEKFAVIDQHWEEWKAQPEAVDEKSMKPWQREVRRLDEVAAAAAKEMQAIARPSASPSPAVAEVTGLTKELRDSIASWITATEKFQATRWAKTDFEDPAQKKTLTRRDFEEAVELSRVAAEYHERILKLLAQAKSQGIDVSAATTDPSFLSPEFWRAFQEMYALRLKSRKLIDQHWDEWLTAPEAVDTKSKPWQREIKRLDDQVEARRKQLKAHLDSMSVAAATPTPGPARAPSPPANNFDQLALQTHMLPAVADYVTALKRLQATRWVKSPDANAYHPQKITQADLHDADAKLRELIAAIDKLRTDLDAQTLLVPAAEKEYWRIKRETSIAFQQLTKLLEDNWKEWRVNGIEPKKGEPKPWQKEALRLQGEVDKLKQFDGTSVLL